MKKLIALLLAVCMVFTLAACGASRPAEEDRPQPAAPHSGAEWTRTGYYSNGNGNILSVTWMDDIVDPGWYVGCMLGEDLIEDSYGGTLQQEGNSLHGSLTSGGAKPELTVTVSEEGEDGLILITGGSEPLHFLPMEMETASIIVTVSTEGRGGIDHAEGESALTLDPEESFQWSQINLSEPAFHTFAAWPKGGSCFVKWTKNGVDFSEEPQITVLLDESADYVAVFEEDPDWQNPVMNFIGEYQSGRAHALVECFGSEDALITIEWGGSAWEMARWTIVGRLDTETLTVTYSGCTKSVVVYDETGSVRSEETEYDDGTGTVVFGEGLNFTWHEDQSEYGTDMVFEWIPVVAEP